MKTTYIYLNTYSNGYLYVGSHTWDGEVGVVDPDYIGSSGIAKGYGWIPEKIEILEVVEGERRYSAEREWILKYCKEFGVSSISRNLQPLWAALFKDGIMLNCCSVDHRHLHAGITKEVTLRSQLTRNANGSTRRWIESAHTEEANRRRVETNKIRGNYKKIIEATHSEEANKKRAETLKKIGHFDLMLQKAITEESKRKSLETRIKTGGFQRFQRAGVEASVTEEAIKRRVEATDYEKAHRKRLQTLKERGVKQTRRTVILIKDSVEIGRGSVLAMCGLAGNKGWQPAVNSKFLKGATAVEHHGYSFLLVE